jgi:hypothetical protein
MHDDNDGGRGAGNDPGRDAGLGRRTFFKVTAGGLAAAGIAGVAVEALAHGEEGAKAPRAATATAGAAHEPAAAGAAATTGHAGSQVLAAHWRQRRVDFGETAVIEVAVPGVADGTPVTAVVYRRQGKFRRYLGAVRGAVQAGAAALYFRAAPIGPAADAFAGVHVLTFRVRVWAPGAEERLFPPRDLQVLCTRPRFSA